MSEKKKPRNPLKKLKIARATEALDELYLYLTTYESGQLIMDAFHGKLGLREMATLTPEENEMVVLLLRLRKILEDSNALQ